MFEGCRQAAGSNLLTSLRDPPRRRADDTEQSMKIRRGNGHGVLDCGRSPADRNHLAARFRRRLARRFQAGARLGPEPAGADLRAATDAFCRNSEHVTRQSRSGCPAADCLVRRRCRDVRGRLRVVPRRACRLDGYQRTRRTDRFCPGSTVHGSGHSRPLFRGDQRRSDRDREVP